MRPRGNPKQLSPRHGWVQASAVYFLPAFLLLVGSCAQLPEKPAGIHPLVEVYVLKDSMLVRKQGGEEPIPAPFANGWFCMRPESMKALINELEVSPSP